MLASFCKMLHTPLSETDNSGLRRGHIHRLERLFWQKTNEMLTKTRVFYKHYITAAAHTETLAYFPPHSDLLYSSREEGGGGGRTLLSQCSKAGGAERGGSRNSHSESVLSTTKVSVRHRVYYSLNSSMHLWSIVHGELVYVSTFHRLISAEGEIYPKFPIELF